MSTIPRRADQLRQPDDFRKVFALATETALILIAVIVVSRRMSGAFHGSISPAVPCLVATLAAILSLAAQGLWKWATPIATSRTWSAWTTMVLVVLTPLALGAALWTAPSAFVGGYLAALATASLVGAIAIEDSTAGFVLFDQMRSALFEGEELPAQTLRGDEPPNSRDGETSSAKNRHPTETPAVDASADAASLSVADEENESDPSIVQWMTRRRLPDGGELVEGAVRIELDPAATIGVAHLSFSPPLGCDPRAECHLLCDFEGRVRITTAKSYGLRIEARQSGERTFSTTIDVAFTAESRPAASRETAVAA
jgi:hypothetical protein